MAEIMAYTNAIFFLDYVNGSDAARTTLSGVVFSNPSGTTVLGTYVGHGLLTGACITVSGCTQAYANTVWKITKVNDDTFTVDTALWASWNGADVTGNVVPFGGQSWTDAWKTITLGATAARIAPGDTVKIAKSPAPVKLSGATGQATWTNLSKTVTLAEAQTATIDLCEANWSAANATSSARLAVATDAKEGSYCVKMIEDASPAANEVQAYKATGTLDLSGYQKISFWIKNEVAITANMLEINLCSDTNGAVDVDTFPIPAIPSTGRWVPLTIARVGGGNLGSSISSISIANGSGYYTASKYVYLDDFIACTTAGLNLQSLISKNSLEQGGTEAWYGIQSIVGTTVLLDNDVNCKSNQGRGYSTTGTSSETVDTYIRETIKMALMTSGQSTETAVQDDGTFLGGNIQFLGGYNITDATGATCDGESFFDCLNGYGYGGIYASSSRLFLTIKNICLARGDSFAIISSFSNVEINFQCNCSTGISGFGYASVGVIGFSVNNLGYGLQVNGNCQNISFTQLSGNFNGANDSSGYGLNNSNKRSIFHCGNALNNSMAAMRTAGILNRFYDLVSVNNNVCCVICGQNGINTFNNFTFTDVPVVYESTNSDDCIYSTNESDGSSKTYMEGMLIESQDATAGGTGKEWKITIKDSNRILSHPAILSVAKVAVVSSKLVTVTLYFKKSHATDIGARLVCRGGQIAGVAADVYTAAPDDTNRNNVTITFTPTEAGVVEIEAWAYWLSGLAGIPTAYADSTVDAGVKTKVSAANTLSNGDTVTIKGTTYYQYDGDWVVSNVSSTTFDIARVYRTNPSGKGVWSRTPGNVIVDDISITQAD